MLQYSVTQGRIVTSERSPIIRLSNYSSPTRARRQTTPILMQPGSQRFSYGLRLTWCASDLPQQLFSLPAVSMRQAFVLEVNRPTLAECLSGAVEEHSSSTSLTVLRPATRPRRLSAYRLGGAVDLRTTSSGSIEISETYFILPSMRSSKVRAAISPIWCKGCLTVVRGGVIKPAL